MLLLAATVVYFLAICVQITNGACNLRFEVVPAESKLSLSGVIFSKEGSTAKLLGLEKHSVGLTGSVYLSLDSESACPTTPELWFQDLEHLALSTSLSFPDKSLNLYPPMITSQVQGFAGHSLNLSTVGLGLSSMHNADDPTATGTWVADLGSSITSGYMFSESLASPTPLAPLQRLQSHVQSRAVLAYSELRTGGQLAINFPDFELLYRLSVGVAHFEEVELKLKGNLVLKSFVGCDKYCGDNGRCLLDNDGIFVCSCDCGWAVDSSGACAIPSGYCDHFPLSLTGAEVISTSRKLSQAESEDNGLCVVSYNGTCPDGFKYAPEPDLCERCPAGYAGPGCMFCTSDAVCQAAPYNYENGQCLHTTEYLEYTRTKAYSCEILDPVWAMFLGSNLQFTCSTVPPSGVANADADSIFTNTGPQQRGSVLDLTDSQRSNSTGAKSPSGPEGTTPYCQIVARLPSMKPDQFAACTTWDCKFSINSSYVQCGVASCECPNGCEGLEDFVSSLSGVATLDCNVSPCLFSLSSISTPPIPVSCNTSECYNPHSNTSTVTETTVQTSSSFPKEAVVSAIPIMILLTLTVLCASALFSFRIYFTLSRSTSNNLDSDTIMPMALSVTASQPLAESYELSSTKAGQPIAEGTESTPQDPTTTYMTPLSPAGSATASKSADIKANAAMHSRYGSDAELVMHAATSSGDSVYSLSGYLIAQLAQAPVPNELRFVNIRAHVKQRRSWTQFLRCQCLTGKSSSDQVSEEPGAPILAETSADLKLREPCESPISSGLPSPVTMPGYKTVVKGISGSIKPGEIMGLMGPSGGGKSTLLNVITGQIINGRMWKLSGEITIGTVNMSASKLSQHVAYVPQDELLLRSLTIQESLMFSAGLRLNSPAEVVASEVDRVIQALRLTKVRNNKVWAISGGERRRVSIGMELVTNPKTLVLDEPTSGLDSCTASKLLVLLKQLALGNAAGRQDRPVTVIASLHQPSPSLFDMLDTALLIAAGNTVYLGPPRQAASTMAALGAPCPADMAIAEHLLFVVSDSDLLPLILCRLEKLQEEAAAKALPTPTNSTTNDKVQVSISAEPEHPDPTPNRPPHWLYKWYKELGLLSWRMVLDFLRHPVTFLFHVSLAMLMGIVVGFVYYQVDDKQSGAQNRVGAFFFSIILMGFTCFTAIDLVSHERNVFERETIRHWYRPSAYVLPKLVVDGLMLRCIPATLYGVAVYYLMGLNPDTATVFTFFWVFLTFNMITGAGCLALAFVFRRSGTTILTMNLILLVGALFAGFMVNKPAIPWALRWISYLSVFRYAWDALCINEMRGLYLYFSAPNINASLRVSGLLFLEVLGVDVNGEMVDIIVQVCIYIGVVLTCLMVCNTHLVWRKLHL